VKSSLRTKADNAKRHRCKNLIVVLENPKTIENIASTLRNIDAFGAEKLYVVDGNNLLPDTWSAMRQRTTLNKISASASKWVFTRKFKNTTECLNHLKYKNFLSMVTSPHLKGKNNISLDGGIYTQPRLAVWFGNESKGVSDEAINNSKYCINIEINGIIESLNLGTSTGVVLYEVTKQRRKFLKDKHARK
jgi:tRNA (guanosine-2'-O-)-methyltransferase